MVVLWMRNEMACVSVYLHMHEQASRAGYSFVVANDDDARCGLPASQASLDTVFLSVLLMHGDCRTVCLEDVRVDLANTWVSGWHGRFWWWW